MPAAINPPTPEQMTRLLEKLPESRRLYYVGRILQELARIDFERYQPPPGADADPPV
ncbi:MAG: hypothetical protein NZL92_09780 [Gloeomargarita sp. SKYG116]|nr:hypothetical protein [Gloeomargarita sp. SKYG116]MCS7226750.1 hypothetical protein [Gloeomargarita sp. SKYB31]MDW8401971.1 hypothetical protein [Gloeomargarita sp. SKYGB_i_bin116]